MKGSPLDAISRMQQWQRWRRRRWSAGPRLRIRVLMMVLALVPAVSGLVALAPGPALAERSAVAGKAKSGKQSARRAKPRPKQGGGGGGKAPRRVRPALPDTLSDDNLPTTAGEAGPGSAAPTAAPATAAGSTASEPGAAPARKPPGLHLRGAGSRGKLKTPQLLYFRSRMRQELDTSSPPRRSFLKELETNRRR